VPRKSEIEKERETKGKRREKISPPLDLAAASAGGRGPPVLGAHQGACPLSFAFISRSRKAGCSVASHKSSAPAYSHFAGFYS